MISDAKRLQLLRGARAERDRRISDERRKDLAERDLLEFVRMFWHVTDPAQPLVEGWPLEAIVEHLMAVHRGDIKRLLINVPPGFSKSTTTDVFFPAWEWGPRNQPHMRYICTSYSQHLTERDNSRFLRVVQSPLYQRFWGDRFSIEREGVHQIKNNKTGWKLATSMGGLGAGERGNRVIIDDPNNTNPNQVESAIQREGINGVIREVLPDRLNDVERDAIICIQQRVHGSDVTATLLEHAEDYVHFVVPMEFDATRHCVSTLQEDEHGEPLMIWQDPRGLDDEGDKLTGVYFDKHGNPKVQPGSPMADADGELAWPERFSAEAMRKMKAIKGAYAWAGQYQQLPTPRGGAIILAEWWQVWTAEEFPEFELVVVALDTAYKEGQENDYNAFTVWGVFRIEGRVKVMLVNAWRGRCSLPELVQIVGTECQKRKADYLLIEDKARGHDTAAAIQTSYGRRAWQTVLLNPGRLDKVERLQAVQQCWAGDVRVDPATGKDVWSGGMIYAPDRDYADNVIRQMEAFPKVTHDDETDTASMAITWLRAQGVLQRDEEYEWHRHDEETYEKPEAVPYDV